MNFLKKFKYRKTGRSAYRMTVSLFIATIISAICIFTMLFYSGILQNDLETSGFAESSLVIAFDKIDDTLKNCENVIRNNKNTLQKDLLSINKNEVISLVEDLQNIKMYCPFVEEIVLYKKNDSNYITSQGTITKENFFKQSYFEEKRDIAYWEKIMQQYNTPAIIPLSKDNAFNYTPDTIQPLFVVPQTYPIYNSGILIFVNESTFMEYCGLSRADIQSQIVLFDSEGVPLLSNDQILEGKKIDLIKLQNSASYQRGGLISDFEYTKWFEYKSMIYQIKIHNTASLVYLLTILALVLLGGLGCLIIKRNYTEYQKSVEAISSIVSHPHASAKELPDIVEEYKSLSSFKENHKVCKAILLRCIQEAGFYQEGREIILKICPELLSGRHFQIAYLILNQIKNKKNLPDCKQLENILKADNEQTFLFQDGNLRYLLLLSFSGESPSYHKLIQTIGEYANVIIVKSEIFDSFASAHNVFREFLDCYLKIPVNTVNGHLEKEDLKEEPGIFSIQDISSEIQKCVSTYRFLDLNQILSKEIEAAIKSGITYGQYQFFIRSLYHEFISVIEQYKMDDNILQEASQLFLKSLHLYSQNADAHAVKAAFLNMTMMTTSKLNIPKKSSLNNEIIKYIEENYSEELYIEKIAQYFQFTNKYFSYYFKKEFKIGFLEYVSKLRVEKAKQLLQNTDYPISNISRMVGYANPITFGVVFKKHTGISPSDFRKKKN